MCQRAKARIELFFCLLQHFVLLRLRNKTPVHAGCFGQKCVNTGIKYGPLKDLS